MQRLETLRDRIYTRRRQNFHWDLTTSIETCGDYRLGIGSEEQDRVPATAAVSTSENQDEPVMANLHNSLNYFLAVKTASGCPDLFWIARTLRIED